MSVYSLSSMVMMECSNLDWSGNNCVIMSLMDKQMDNIGSSSNSGKKQQNYLAIPQLLSIFKQLPPCNMQQYCDVRPTTVLTTCKRA